MPRLFWDRLRYRYIAVGNQNELQYLSSTAVLVRFEGSLPTIGSGVAWDGPGRFRTRSHIGFQVPGSKSSQGSGRFRMFQKFRMCCISGCFGGEGFRGLRGIGRFMDGSGSF